MVLSLTEVGNTKGETCLGLGEGKTTYRELITCLGSHHIIMLGAQSSRGSTELAILRILCTFNFMTLFQNLS